MKNNLIVLKTTKDILHKDQIERLEEKISDLEMKIMAYNIYSLAVISLIVMSFISYHLVIDDGDNLSGFTIFFLIITSYMYISTLFLIYKDFRR